MFGGWRLVNLDFEMKFAAGASSTIRTSRRQDQLELGPDPSRNLADRHIGFGLALLGRCQRRDFRLLHRRWS